MNEIGLPVTTAPFGSLKPLTRTIVLIYPPGITNNSLFSKHSSRATAGIIVANHRSQMVERPFPQRTMNTEQILLLAALLGLLTAVLALGKSYLEYETVRLKNDLQKKINAAAKKKEQ